MTTTAADALFIDTNILVYADVLRAPHHEEALAVVQSYLSAGTAVWISRQVLREYMSVVTRPQVFAAPLPSATAAERAREFERMFHVADETRDVTERLFRILGEIPVGGKQIHDANIVATMLENGVTTLVTDNSGDFRRFESLIRVVPLLR